MSSAEIAAQHIKTLSYDEVNVLALLERYLRRFEIFPIETLQTLSNFTPKYLDKTISLLEEKKLMLRIRAPYDGAILTTTGLDALALYTLTSMDLLSHFGNRIGVGKESDIFDGLNPEEERVSLKFYRIGRTSFRDVLRKRRYTSPQSSVPWLVRSVRAAGREYKALEILYGLKVSVPQPLGRDRHVIAMEFLEGEIVAYAKEVLNPNLVLNETLRAVGDAFRAGLVNGDLSAYNVFVTRDERVLIIDWPQWISSKSRMAPAKLQRDIQNLCEYFEKRLGVRVDSRREYEKIVSGEQIM